MSAPCPHCGKETELQLVPPPIEPTVPKRVLIWTAITVLILVAGLAIAVIGLNHYKAKIALQHEQAAAAAQKAAEPPTPPPEDPIAKSGFEVSKIKLEKTPASTLVYAVGTVYNKTNKQRFGVRIEMDLLDAGGQPVGTAKDYQAVIEPQGKWSFKALVVNSKAVAAKVTSVIDDQK